jgi:hypothetical protein
MTFAISMRKVRALMGEGRNNKQKRKTFQNIHDYEIRTDI